MQSTGKVTLVSTVFNDLDSCKQFMEQMLGQKRRPDEIVMVDAGSRDGTWEWMQEMAGNAPIPFVAHQEKKCNIARGRNLAIERASHEIIVSTDLGNEWTPEWLEELVTPLEMQPDCQAVMGSWEVRYGDLKSDWARTEYAVLNGLRFLATPQSDASSRAISYRKSLWRRIGGYPEDLSFSGDDLAYSFLLHRTTDKIGCAPTPRCFWQRHEKLKDYCKESRRYQRGTAEAGLSLNYGLLVGGRMLAEVVCGVLGLALLILPSTRLAGVALCLMALASILLRLRRIWPAAARARKLGVSHPFWRVAAFEYLIRYWGVVGYWDGFFGGARKCQACRSRIRKAGDRMVVTPIIQSRGLSGGILFRRRICLDRRRIMCCRKRGEMPGHQSGIWMQSQYPWPGLLRSLFLVCLCFFAATALRGQVPTLNVADFGAKGDAIRTSARTVQNSTLVSLNPTNVLTAADVGKAIELFGVGPNTSGTNYQDLIAWIVGVTNGNSVFISLPAGCTASNIACTYGTQNATAFQNCVNACTGPNTDITIPAGCYLLLPPRVFNTSYVMTSYADGAFTVVIHTGGIRFLGSDPDNTILLGNGAWQLQGAYCHRGYMFCLQGPVTSTNALVFQDLTFDGGVQQGRQIPPNWPGSPVNGSGWDVTHGAVLDYGPLPLHHEKDFINCHIIHWRGEMVKSITAWDSGIIQMTNCQFLDGAGSGYNFNWTPHVISGCLFSNLDMAMEFYVGTMQSPSVFENSEVTNVINAIVLVGGLTSHPSPGYMISNNVLSATDRGILIGPARNLIIAGNQFDGGGGAVVSDGSAYQGNDTNRDIVVENNTFNQVFTPIGVGGEGGTGIENMTVLSNTAWGANYFAAGYGWSTNIFFYGNRSLAPVNGHGNLGSGALLGQWFYDDPSNQFPPQGDPGDPGQTNSVSYAMGMHHQVYANTNVTFYLNDQSPAQVPPGAMLVVSNECRFNVAINASLRNPLPVPAILAPEALLVYNWNASSNQWTLAIRPGPPANLRLGR